MADSERLKHVDSFVFLDRLQGRRVVFGSQEVFDVISNGSEVSVVALRDLKDLPKEVIEKIADDYYRLVVMGPETYGVKESCQVVFVPWRLLPREFDVTDPTNSAQRGEIF